MLTCRVVSVLGRRDCNCITTLRLKSRRIQSPFTTLDTTNALYGNTSAFSVRTALYHTNTNTNTNTNTGGNSHSHTIMRATIAAGASSRCNNFKGVCAVHPYSPKIMLLQRRLRSPSSSPAWPSARLPPPLLPPPPRPLPLRPPPAGASSRRASAPSAAAGLTWRTSSSLPPTAASSASSTATGAAR